MFLESSTFVWHLVRVPIELTCLYVLVLRFPLRSLLTRRRFTVHLIDLLVFQRKNLYDVEWKILSQKKFRFDG